MAMEILLVRHGEAVEDGNDLGDAGRWLTAKGRRVTRKVAAFLAEKKERRPAKIWTSPLIRAVQTAEILAHEAGMEGDVFVRSELAPGREASGVVDLIARFQPEKVLAVVGHEPMLSTIAAILLPRVAFPGLRKSGVVALTWEGEGPAAMRFLLTPKGLEITTSLPAKAPQ